MSLREIADQHLGPALNSLVHDVEIAVAVQVERDRGARTERAHHGQAACGIKSTPHGHRRRFGTRLTPTIEESAPLQSR